MTDLAARAWLIDMRRFAPSALRILACGGDDEIAADEILFLALCRAGKIVGGAANHVPREVQSGLPQIDWRGLIGMRHRLIHGYSSLAGATAVRLAGKTFRN
jgi:uncharacterized protein with HEPN domain